MRWAVAAPCGIFDPERLAKGVAIAAAAGHELLVPDDVQIPWRYLAGDDDHRRSTLQAALDDEGVDGVWIARGGYGMTRILADLMLDSPRPVVGFSDVTPLLNRLPYGIHGPVVHSLHQTDDASLAHLWALLDGQPTPTMPGETWVEGSVTGRLVGGNLALLAATCGTPHQLDTTGAILVIEDVGEPFYKIDRMLQQLRAAGLFARVAGIVFGDFVGCRPRNGATWTLKDVLLDKTGDVGVPVIGNVPIGHGSANRAFRIGARATVSSEGLTLSAG